MNKILSIVICLSLILSLTACFEMHPPAEPAPPQSEPASVSSVPESSESEEPLPALHLDYFDTAVITHTDAWDKNEQAVAEWAKYVYQEFGVSEANAAYISGNVGLSADSDKGCIDVRNYRILLKSDKPIPDSYDKGDGEYITNVISVAAAPNMQTEQTVIDILTPDRFDMSDHIDVLYECVVSDGRFADYLLPYKEDVLPEGAVLTDLSALLPEYSSTVWRDSRLMADGSYAFAYVHSITENDGAVAIMFVNANGYKSVETGIRTHFQDYYQNIYPWVADFIYLDNYMFSQNSDYVTMYRYGEEIDEEAGIQKIDHLLRIFPDGTVNEYGGDEAHTAYYTYEYPCENGEHLVIQEFDSIYLAGEDSRELLLHLPDEEKGDGKFDSYKSWRFIEWLDNDRFICSITGYFGNAEYYIYNISTRSLAQFETVEDTFVHNVHDGKIILVPNPMVTASTDAWQYDPDTGETSLLTGMPVDFMAGSYSIDGDFFVSAEHTEYPYGDFTIKVYDPAKGEVVKSIEGYLHHNRLGPFGYKDGKLCGLIESGPFTPTYYAVFE